MAGNLERLRIDSHLGILVRRQPAKMTLSIAGEADLSNGARLFQVLSAAAKAASPARIHLDLAALAFADGCGRRALVRFSAEQTAAGREVVVSAPRNRALAMSLELGGLSPQPSDG